MVIAEACEFARERGVLVAGHDLDLRPHVIVAVPLQESFELARVARFQPDDRVEARHRQVARHQGPAVSDLAMRDADRIAGEPREHIHARERVGHFRFAAAADQFARGNDRLHRRLSLRTCRRLQTTGTAPDRAQARPARDAGTHGRSADARAACAA